MKTKKSRILCVMLFVLTTVAGVFIGITYSRMSEIPPPMTGFLAVTTSPVLGHIYVNGSYNIGDITLELENGTYTITYGNVSDYITPVSQTVEIFEDITTTVEGIYVKEEIYERKIYSEVFPYVVTIYNESKIYKSRLLFDLEKKINLSSISCSENIGGYHSLILDENFTIINSLGEFGVGVAGKSRGEWLDSNNIILFQGEGKKRTGFKIWNLETNKVSPLVEVYTHHDFQLIDDTIFCLGKNSSPENKTLRWDTVLQYDFNGNLTWIYDLMDIVPSEHSYQELRGDITHANSLHFDGERVYVNARNTHTVYVIDYETKDLLYSFGKYGDFEMLGESQWYASHSFVKINETDFLMFDNHGNNDEFDTRAIYNRINFDDMTIELVQEWIIPADLYCGSWGNVQLLPNNNILMSAGTTEHATDEERLLGGAILEYTYDGELVSKIQFPIGWGIFRAFKEIE